jgi:uncharacterized protein YlxW (UPF0749 family)
MVRMPQPRWLRHLSRRWSGRRTPPGTHLTRRWHALVPVVCLVCGVGFAVSARESRGTDLRPAGKTNLADLVRSAEREVKQDNARLLQVQAQVDAAAAQAGKGDSGVAAAEQQVAGLAGPAGLTAVHGPGIVVVLDDAPASAATAGVDPNQLVVHQSDLQAVVNALWTGGAEAMTIAGQRIIATSAVRCVGNTLLLNGEVYSPPFRVAAIGPYQQMQQALGASPGVRLFQQAAGYYGLGYTTESAGNLRLPAYRGTMSLAYARAGGS